MERRNQDLVIFVLFFGGLLCLVLIPDQFWRITLWLLLHGLLAREIWRSGDPGF